MTLTLDSLLAAHKTEAPAPAPVKEAPALDGDGHVAGGFTRGRPADVPGVKPASAASIRFFKSLVAERAPETSEAKIAEIIALGQRRVSKAIDKLKLMPKVEAPAPVEAEVADEAVEVWPGIYTVETDARHFTFKVVAQASDAEFAPGKLILEVLTGQDNTSDYTAIAFIIKGQAKVWKSRQAQVSEAMQVAIHQFLADPDAALEAKHCLRCNALLTVPASVASGYGPECIKKGRR